MGISTVHLKRQVFSIENEVDFEACALEVFRFQAAKTETFSNYLRQLGKRADSITKLKEIPFLPISFFKSHRILAGDELPPLYFQSSGTGETGRSTHFIADPSVYEKSLTEAFRRIYGDPSSYVFLALLPSYLDNPHNSLIYMMKTLMEHSGQPLSGFFKDEFDTLSARIDQCKKEGKRIFLWGVTYALLQFADLYRCDLGSNAIVLETGGMKGKGKELIREELHEILRKKFEISSIESEYGMSELLSQAYCRDGMHFTCPPWMRIVIRDIYDPFQTVPDGQSGAINVIDLANFNSCSFIATDDIGRKTTGGFEVLGRLDHSDIRGCNLLAL